MRIGTPASCSAATAPVSSPKFGRHRITPSNSPRFASRKLGVDSPLGGRLDRAVAGGVGIQHQHLVAERFERFASSPAARLLQRGREETAVAEEQGKGGLLGLVHDRCSLSVCSMESRGFVAGFRATIISRHTSQERPHRKSVLCSGRACPPCFDAAFCDTSHGGQARPLHGPARPLVAAVHAGYTIRYLEKAIAMSVYTRTGDHGETDLLGGVRVPKGAALLDVCGALDELNALLGLARCEPLAEGKGALIGADPASPVRSRR